MRVVIAPDGSARSIYADALRDVYEALGMLTVRRASHVEPGADGQWYADLSPVGGPVLGPYRLRREALDAEVEALRERGF